jgi:hypothetical protein
MSILENQAQKPTSTLEMLAYIHDWSLKQQAKPQYSVEWDCAVETGIHYAEMDAEQNLHVDNLNFSKTLTRTDGPFA